MKPPPPRPKTGATRSPEFRRQLLSAADQGLSGLTNVIVVLAIAKVLTPDTFGAFSLVYTGLTMAVGVSRAFFGIPIAIASADSPEQRHRLYLRSVSAVMIVSPVILGALFFLGWAVAPGWLLQEAFLAVLITAIAAPLIVIQDVSRYYAIASHRAAIALTSDAIWFVAAMSLFLAGPLMGPQLVLFIWLVSVAAAALAAAGPLGFRADLAGGLGLLKIAPGLRESVAATVLLSNGTTLAVGFMVAPVFGIQAVGSLRGAGTLFGPINSLISLLDFSVLGYLARRDRAKDVRFLFSLAGIACALSAVWGIALLLLPYNWGYFLLGETWEGARSLLPVVALEYIVLAAVASLALTLKARLAAGPILWSKISSSVVILVAVAVAVLAADALIWVSAALVVGAVAGLVAMSVSLSRLLQVKVC